MGSPILVVEELTMKLLVLFLFVSTSLADPWSEFQSFKAKHGKTYGSSKEETTRFAIFKENLEKIEKHNQEGHSWQLGLTKFADLTQEEFTKTYASGRINSRLVSSNARNVNLPSRKDIRLEDLPGPLRLLPHCLPMERSMTLHMTLSPSLPSTLSVALPTHSSAEVQADVWGQ